MTYLIVYTSAKGRDVKKAVTEDQIDRWIDKLDKRIAAGTCKGYIITAIR